MAVVLSLYGPIARQVLSSFSGASIAGETILQIYLDDHWLLLLPAVFSLFGIDSTVAIT